ncbi:MAG: hypothetical protein JWN04_5338 [Myxococcaceae bacterium]|nr:hypothetical protein [Myxococcaceae bacterium]
MDTLSSYHLDALAGALVLLFVANEKRLVLRDRKRAVRVTASVVRVYSHMHATSYYFRYVWEGRERTAKYNGPPLRVSFSPGEDVDILVDLTEPGAPIPETHPNDPAALVGEGNCQPAGSACFTVWDALFAVTGVLLIYSSFRRA